MEQVWGKSCVVSSRRAVPTWKRLLDLALILLALPILLPLFLLLGLWIKLSSRGPVIFRQERVGYRGTRFTCFKFRTMRPGANVQVHKQHLQQLMTSEVPMTKLDCRGDARLIPLARLFRATGLDELPQLINILRGEMSLVGPRPCIPYEYEQYLPWQKQRFNTLPGLTGLWQVSGKNETTFGQMIYLDIAYVKNMSLWLDLVIILKTIPALARQFWNTRARRNSTTKPS